MLEASCADMTEPNLGEPGVVRAGVGGGGAGGGGSGFGSGFVVVLKFPVEVAASALAVATRAPRTGSRQRAPDGHLRLLIPAQRVDCQGSALEKVFFLLKKKGHRAAKLSCGGDFIHLRINRLKCQQRYGLPYLRKGEQVIGLGGNYCKTHGHHN